MIFKLDEKSFKATAANTESLFDKVARKATERAMRKAARLGMITARSIAKGIPELGNTKGLRLAVKSYRSNRLVMAYAGWDSKIPVTWLGRSYRSSRHAERIEFGGTVKRRGKKIRTQPYSVLRKSFEQKKGEMQKQFIDILEDFMRKEAAKLNK